MALLVVARVVLPPPVPPRGRIRVVAPSGPFDRTLALKGLAWLSSRYRVEYDRGIFRREGFLAGTDHRRLDELDAALRSDVHAVVAVRGGYGLGRIAHHASWRLLAERPKWLVGFSDATVLHVEAARVGVASMHGPMVASLGRGDARGREAFAGCLEGPTAPRVFDGLRVLHPGAVAGPLFGGNLTVLAACHAAGRLRVPEGAVLLLEDVSEAPYRIDRTLTSLLIAGALDRVAGVVLGDFTDCDAGRHGVPVEDVLAERLAALRVPVSAGLPVGHGPRNEPVVLGARARLEGAKLVLEVPRDAG